MTHDAAGDAARPAGARPLPVAADAPGRDPMARAPGGDAAEICQQAVTRLFAAGVTLNSALELIRDGPAATPVRLAVDEIDAAIREIRTMMFALPEQAAPDSAGPRDRACLDGGPSGDGGLAAPRPCPRLVDNGHRDLPPVPAPRA